ncbi:MAG: patatin-like protein [Dongiaceae bacterium]
MKQIEVRLALVLYGGVSLAVYIHGVTREILNLVRASKQFQAGRAPPDRVRDTTAVYLDLFETLSPVVDLRVVVDLISGASAGGINGVMLARAIAHDLPLEPLRDLWLQNADVTRLAAPSRLLSRLAKAPVAALTDHLVMGRFGRPAADPETRAKLRHFIKAPWFTPPFSGKRFVGWMLDACDAMESDAEPGASLLPPGHRLDLFVTVTDYRGHRHRIALHDPPVVEETEHRRIVAFACRRALSGETISEFGTGHVPSLVFASRATASFPGAFPPATIGEIDAILAARRRDWPARSDFLTDKLKIGDGPEPTGFFIDGSVVMNKPFAPVIHALGNRPAAREVVRRIVYVDPNPAPDAIQRGGEGAPGFFRTILSSLALIPRNEPIADDLSSIEEWNGRARRMAEILAAADPEVERLVGGIVRDDPNNPPTIAEVGRYRAAANEAAHTGAGYAYLSYQKLKLRQLVERLSDLVAALAGRADAAVHAADVGRLLDRWMEPDGERTSPRIIQLLRAFDVDFRLRRARFVIRRLNELYRTVGETEPDLDTGAIDDLKAALYEVTERIVRLWDPASHLPENDDTAVRIATAAANGMEPAAADLEALEAAMGLVRIDENLDEIVSVMGLAFLPPVARRAVAMAYVGFAFYDLITYPILQWTDLAEINEVLVDRISPADARGLRSGRVTLRGTSLMSFGAFFNRAWREHDYLWGRLNAADRCVDVLMSAIGKRARELVDADRLRRHLILAILDAEAPHLTADPGLIPALRREVEERYGGG